MRGLAQVPRPAGRDGAARSREAAEFPAVVRVRVVARGLLNGRVPKVLTGGLRAIRGDIHQAEFDAIDAAVRYYEGNATHAEYVAAKEHLKLLSMATDFERRQAVRNLWRRRPPRPPLPN